MDINKLSRILIGLGAVLIAAALVWWMIFYGKVTKEVKASLLDAVPCIFKYGGECGMIAAFTSLVGYTPYSPTLFWFGVAALGGGIILKVARKDT